jgi:SAM-dependent methyltransferase
MKTWFISSPPFAPLLQPFALARRGLSKMERKVSAVPMVATVIRVTDLGVEKVRRYFEASFDRRFGTETIDVIQLKDLDVEGESVRLGHWYIAISEGIFHQIFDEVEKDIDFSDKTFVDYGSGKGRVLFLAAERGFPKNVGVEFSVRLSEIADRNIIAYNQSTNRSSEASFENICCDAMEYQPPLEPLVLFFFSPFKGIVMQKVLDNIMASYAKQPRQVSIVFYGENKDTIQMLDETGFVCRELDLKPDWTCLEHYRALLFHSAEVGG